METLSLLGRVGERTRSFWIEMEGRRKEGRVSSYPGWRVVSKMCEREKLWYEVG